MPVARRPSPVDSQENSVFACPLLSLAYICTSGPDTVRKLEVWRLGIELVKQAYEITRGWPKEEIYGLSSQVRRAAVSVPSNLAEGVGRATPAEAARFAQIAIGSLYELDTLFQIAESLGYALPVDPRPALNKLIRKVSAFAEHQRRRRPFTGSTSDGRQATSG